MRPWRSRPALALLVLALVAIATTSATGATFAGQTASTGNRVSAAPDFRAPSASASLVVKSQTPGSATGHIRQGGSYRVYADVTDTGNPASGTAAVTADVSLFSAGITAAPLSAGSYSVGGVTYSHRSAVLVADDPVAEGAKSFTLGLTDAAANSATAAGFSVIVDNAAPSATDIQTTSGGTAGTPSDGDRMIYTYSEPIDADTIMSGWNGASADVDVTVVDGGGGLLGLGPDDDVFTVKPDGAGTDLPLTVGLGSPDYAWGGLALLRSTCHATFNSSTMAMSANTITVTLGGSAGCPKNEGSSATLTYVPSAGATDWAGNALPTTARTELGGADRDF